MGEQTPKYCRGVLGARKVARLDRGQVTLFIALAPAREHLAGYK